MIRQQSTYKERLEQGKELIQKFSSRAWTDFLEHDPGITTLEFICYALTDLDLRTRLPVEDILAAHLETKKHSEPEIRYPNGRPLEILSTELKQKPILFHYPDEILPSGPLTISDYRMLLLDIPGVRNVWLTPGLSNKGYSAKFVFAEEIDVEQRTKLLHIARDILDRHRNLCERFDSIREANFCSVDIGCALEVGDNVNLVDLEAHCLIALEDLLTPVPAFCSLGYLLKHKMKVENIFEGPLLAKGFLVERELEQTNPRTTVNRMDIRRALAAVPGVVGVRNVSICRPSVEATTNLSEVNIQGTEAVCLKLGATEFKYVYGWGSCLQEEPRTRRAVAQRMLELRGVAAADRMLNNGQNIDRPVGDGHEVIDYTSIQNHFPACYGLGEQGVPESSNVDRHAQMKQFAGYLLLFDQLMADYLAQLANTRNLLGSQATATTYFSQPVNDCFNLAELLRNHNNAADELEEETANQRNCCDRRNRFLDHLLARYAEDVQPHIRCSPESLVSKEMTAVIHSKEVLLQEYPQLSSKRARGRNLSSTISFYYTTEMEERIRLHLAMRYPDDLANLAEIFIRTHETNEFSKIQEYRFYLKGAKNSVILGGLHLYRNTVEMDKVMRDVLVVGRHEFHYRIQEVLCCDGQISYTFLLDNGLGRVIAEHPNVYVKKEDCRTAMYETIDFLRLFNVSEPFHVVENILLEPQGDTEAIPLFPDSPGDFYSFRICILLPSYAEYYAQRGEIEHLIGEYIPAHVLPQFIWLTEEQMEQFEAKYSPWLTARADGSTSEMIHREPLVKFLNDLMLK